MFAGHLHRNAEARAANIAVVTTGPVGKPLGGALEHHYYALEKLPERID